MLDDVGEARLHAAENESGVYEENRDNAYRPCECRPVDRRTQHYSAKAPDQTNEGI
jgi:hypothetical protein